MSKENIIKILIISVLIFGFTKYWNVSERYTFQLVTAGSELPTVFIGDTQTGSSWICTSRDVFEEGKKTATWKKSYKGCLEFVSPSLNIRGL
jgi:hypothetical protein